MTLSLTSKDMSTRPLCLLTGSDGVRRDDILELWKSAWIRREGATLDVAVLESDHVQAPELLQQLSSVPMIQPRRVVILKINDKLKPDLERVIEEFIDDPFEQVAFLVVGEKVDARKKWVKKFSSHHIDVATPGRYAWSDWICERAQVLGTQISKDAAHALFEWVGENPRRLNQELKKIAVYVDQKKAITLRDVETMISGIPMIVVFSALDSLMEGDLKVALKSFRALLAHEEPPLKLLALLIRHVRLLLTIRTLMAQGIRQPQELASRVGLNPYFLKRYLSQATQWSTPKLLKAISLLNQTDKGLKGERRLDPVHTFESKLVEFSELTA